MSKCDTCKHKSDDEGWMFCDRCIHSPELEDMCKPATYADHIRSMTDEELAEWLMQLENREMEDVLPYCSNICSEKGLGIDEITNEMCKRCLVAKLQQPYESPTGQKG